MVSRYALLLALAIAPFGAAAAPDSWTVTIDGPHISARGCVPPSGDDGWGRICLFYYCMPPVRSGYSGLLDVDYVGIDELEMFEEIEELRLGILIDDIPYGEVSLTRAEDDWQQYLFPQDWNHDALVTALRAGHDLTLRALPVPGWPMPPDMHISLAKSNHALGTMLSHCPPE